MTRTLHSPSNIEVLIHIYCNPEPHPREDSMAVQEALLRFIQDGVVIKNHAKASGYAVTKKGRAWLNMILDTPYPEERWINPISKKVIDIT